MQSDKERARATSNDHGLLGDSDITIEDLTVMKIMEEIMELDQEIKMKQKWMDKRMKMLGKLLPNQKKSTAQIVETFMLKIEAAQPAIPLGQANVYEHSIPLKQGDVFE